MRLNPSSLAGEVSSNSSAEATCRVTLVNKASRRSSHWSIPLTIPARLESTSQSANRPRESWPSESTLTGHSDNHFNTSDRDRSLFITANMPSKDLPEGVELRGAGSGPAVGIPAKANWVEINDAYGSRCRYKTAILWNGVPASERLAISRTIHLISSLESGALNIWTGSRFS